MFLYIALLLLAVCIRYSKNIKQAELFGLLLSTLVIVTQWREKGFLAILLIVLVVCIRQYQSSQLKNWLLTMILLVLALVWYGEAKYSSISFVLDKIGFVDLQFDVIVSVVGASYILMRLLNYILSNGSNLSLLSSLHYILFAPALPTGPIQTVDEYKSSRIKLVPIIDTAPLLGRIVWGVLKVFIISSYIAPYALDFDNVVLFESVVWLNVVLSLCAYTIYLYLNFSGSIDIVIGLSNLLGWKLPENFNWPLLATNIQDFWRRWHMSLTNTLRNIFFVPFVKQFSFPEGDWRRYIVSVIGFYLIFGLSALWHNFTYNFLLWGVWHATGMTVHYFYKRVIVEKAIFGTYVYKAFSWLITFVFVSLGWIFFTYPSPAIVNKALNYDEFSVQEIELAKPYGSTILVNYKPVLNGYVDVLVNSGEGYKEYATSRDGKYNFAHIHGVADKAGDRSLVNKSYSVKLNFYDVNRAFLYSYNRPIVIKNGK